MINKAFNINSKYILLLSMLYVAISTAATATAYKFVSIGIASVSGATIIFPLNSYLAIVITEVYGFTVTKQLIWLGLLGEIVFALLVILVIHLPSPAFWDLQLSFDSVLGSSLRFVLSGVAADLVGMFGGAYLISKWKVLMRGKHFLLRGIASAIISDFLMTIVIGLTAFYGKIPLSDLLQILLSGYLLHIVYAIVLIWPSLLLANYLKRIENIDVYDHEVKYNPFQFNLRRDYLYAIGTKNSKIS